jgi:hypothetical protein
VILEQSLPDWFSSQEEGSPPDYLPAVRAARKLALLRPEERRAEIERAAAELRRDSFDVSRASGVYIVLRLLFDLPEAAPLDAAEVHGGWIHPTIGQHPFDLSWPIHVDDERRTFTVDRFRGYVGRPYDALAEYDYFAENFRVRSPELLEELRPA